MIILDFFATPTTVLVIDSSIVSIEILFSLFLAVKIAASFITFSISAGVKPAVNLAKTARSTSSAKGFFLE